MNDHERMRREVASAKHDAERALSSLLESRQVIETNGGERRPDLYKLVTGRSSVENAISNTRHMVDTYIRVLDDLDADAMADNRKAPVITVRTPSGIPSVFA